MIRFALLMLKDSFLTPNTFATSLPLALTISSLGEQNFENRLLLSMEISPDSFGSNFIILFAAAFSLVCIVYWTSTFSPSLSPSLGPTDAAARFQLKRCCFVLFLLLCSATNRSWDGAARREGVCPLSLSSPTFSHCVTSDRHCRLFPLSLPPFSPHFLYFFTFLFLAPCGTATTAAFSMLFHDAYFRGSFLRRMV